MPVLPSLHWAPGHAHRSGAGFPWARSVRTCVLCTAIDSLGARRADILLPYTSQEASWKPPAASAALAAVAALAATVGTTASQGEVMPVLAAAAVAAEALRGGREGWHVCREAEAGCGRRVHCRGSQTTPLWLPRSCRPGPRCRLPGLAMLRPR